MQDFLAIILRKIKFCKIYLFKRKSYSRIHQQKQKNVILLRKNKNKKFLLKNILKISKRNVFKILFIKLIMTSRLEPLSLSIYIIYSLLTDPYPETHLN